MTDITANRIADTGEPRLASLVVAGLKWARDALRNLKAVTRQRQLMNETAVRRIAVRADARQARF